MRNRKFSTRRTGGRIFSAVIAAVLLMGSVVPYGPCCCTDCHCKKTTGCSCCIPSPHEIATATCRRCKRRPTDVSEVERKMMWNGYKIPASHEPEASLCCEVCAYSCSEDLFTSPESASDIQATNDSAESEKRGGSPWAPPCRCPCSRLTIQAPLMKGREFCGLRENAPVSDVSPIHSDTHAGIPARGTGVSVHSVFLFRLPLRLHILLHVLLI